MMEKEGYTMKDADKLLSWTQADLHQALIAWNVMLITSEASEKARLASRESQSPDDFARFKDALDQHLKAVNETVKIAHEAGFAGLPASGSG